MRLAYAPANTKLSKLEKRLGVKVYSFDMLSGVTCPAARDCKSWAVERDGKRRIQDGAQTVFRCFSASQEALFTNVFNARKANMEAALGLASRSPMKCAAALVEALPKMAAAIRIHVAGDFKLLNYFDAWREVCERRPDVRFYAYTKMLSFWVKRMDYIPPNLALTASRGGRFDHLIDEHGLREAVVVYSAAQARGLPIDTDDYHAYQLKGGSFALLIHGVQPAGSAAARALRMVQSASKT